MKRVLFTIFCIAIFGIHAPADIPGPNKKPRPTPRTVVTNTKVEPTPVEGPKGEIVREAQMTVSLSYWSEQPTLVLTKGAIEKINAAAKDKGMNTAAITGTGGGLATQTIVAGLFISLAFVFGGVWLARSKGPVSKPALGILMLAITGSAAMLVTANAPPPRRIGLTSAIFRDAAFMNNDIASGKVRIMIVDYDSTDDVSLVIPKSRSGGGEPEE